MNYFTKLKGLCEELDSFQPVPSCDCGETCKCGLGVMRKYSTEGYVVRFLRGLSEQFSGVRLQIMLMDPLPHIDSTFSLLTQQERQLVSIDGELRILFNASQAESQSSARTSEGNPARNSENAYRG